MVEPAWPAHLLSGSDRSSACLARDELAMTKRAPPHFAAHAAARDVDGAAARAAGHAAATAYVASHAGHGASYAVKAATFAAPGDTAATHGPACCFASFA